MTPPKLTSNFFFPSHSFTLLLSPLTYFLFLTLAFTVTVTAVIVLLLEICLVQRTIATRSHLHKGPPLCTLSLTQGRRNHLIPLMHVGDFVAVAGGHRSVVPHGMISLVVGGYQW
ncbi:hypothetical protein TIFTF001_018929 [Ficus carica]|uniref:Uncharacterized protein n=1 Tax=Ficus carica TaxID=3494 RepID=A0AA88D8D1_FICCA|nr:hypothetical protein TIFTF001_018929 [Ficus carica]